MLVVAVTLATSCSAAGRSGIAFARRVGETQIHFAQCENGKPLPAHAVSDVRVYERERSPESTSSVPASTLPGQSTTSTSMSFDEVASILSTPPSPSPPPIWHVHASKPRAVSVVTIGQTPPGFAATTDLTTDLPPSIRVVITTGEGGDSPARELSFDVETMALPADGRVLVNGAVMSEKKFVSEVNTNEDACNPCRGCGVGTALIVVGAVLAFVLLGVVVLLLLMRRMVHRRVNFSLTRDHWRGSG